MAASKTKKKKLLVFLSHASQDKAAVRELCERLRADGFDPWLDTERLLPGQDWDLEIEKALRASDAILLCFSELSVQKEGYIQREYKRAMRYQEEKPDGTIFVIPVRLDKCELPYFIKEIQFVDYPDDYERLVISLNLRSGKLSSAPPVPLKKEPQAPLPASSSSPGFQNTNMSGGINIQGQKVNTGDVVSGSKYVYGSTEPKKGNTLKSEFNKIKRQIDNLPEDADVDKSYLKLFVSDIEKEVEKGNEFNASKLKNSLRLLLQNSEAVYLSITGLLKSDDLEIPHEIRRLVG